MQTVVEKASEGVLILNRNQYISPLAGIKKTTDSLRIPVSQFVVRYTAIIERDIYSDEILATAQHERAVVEIGQASLAEAILNANLLPGEGARLWPHLYNMSSLRLISGVFLRNAIDKEWSFPDGLDKNKVYIKSNARFDTRRHTGRGSTLWHVHYSGRYWQTDDYPEADAELSDEAEMQA